MVLYLIRRSLGDLSAEIHADDMRADRHDHIHVMFYEQDREVKIFVDVGNEMVELLDLFGVHSGGRFVKQKQLRLERDRARDLKAALKSVRPRIWLSILLQRPA